MYKTPPYVPTITATSFTLYAPILSTFVDMYALVFFSLILLSMGSTAIDAREVVSEIPPFITVYDDGTVERPRDSPHIPPSLDDPRTGVSSKDIVISHNPSISARLYIRNTTLRNHSTKIPIKVYFHGGGSFLESAFGQLYHTYLNHLVSQIDVLVVSVEYRLAPEHHVPASYDDCWAALQWVASHFTTKRPTNADPWLIDHGDLHRVFIGGDSGGGNIAHTVAMLAGSKGLPGGIKILGSIYAMAVFCSSQPIRNDSASLISDSFCHIVWNFVYPSAPGGIDNFRMNPVAPGAPSLRGLGYSKGLICLAGKDIWRTRGNWYYELLKNSGWAGRLEFFEDKGEDHIYHIANPESEDAKKLIQRMASFILD